jgi:O-antigen/teichoic acid export membrane protein
VTVTFTQWAASRFRSVSEQHGSLFRNSGALIFGSGMTALLGFVYWWIAARSFSPGALGIASALISLMGFIGLIGEGGIGTLLMGEIIQRHPQHRQGLISAAMLSSFSLSCIVGGIVLVLSRFLFTALHPSLFDYLWVFIGCGLTGNFLIVNKAFVGMLQSGFVTLHQFFYAICKLGLIVLVALWMSTETAILISWVGGLVIAIMLIEAFLRRTGRTLIHPPDFRLLYTLKQKAAHHYLLDLSAQAQILIMPYLVAVVLSPVSNAVFTVVWMVVLLASIIPGTLATIVFPEVRAVPAQYREKMMISFVASIVFAVGFGCLIYLYSSDLLTVFNPTYASIGDSELRFLGFGVIGHTIKSYVGTAARLNNSMARASLIFGIAGLFELACVIVGGRIAGLEGVSIGWSSALLIDGCAMFLLTNPFVHRTPA